MRPFQLCLLLTAASAAICTPALAASSNFNAGAEGWTSAFNGNEPVVWDGGAINVYDNTDGWSYLQAPEAYLAPLATGGSFSFDLRHEQSGFGTGRDYGVRVALTGAGTTVIAELAPPTDNWLRYSFSLTEAAGWRVFGTTQLAYTNSAPVADLALLGSVLGNLSGVYIATDYTNGNRGNGGVDRTFVDNVSLTSPVPEPSTWAMMLAGAAALATWARRRAEGQAYTF